MPLPVTITGLSTAVAPVGPFKFADAYYFFGRDGTTATTLQAYKSGGAAATTIYSIVSALSATVSWGNSATTIRKYQTFTTGASAQTVTSVSFALRKNGSPTDNIAVDLYAFDTGTSLPVGSALGTTTARAGSALTTSLVRTVFTFPTPIPISPNTRYAAVLSRSGAADAVNYYSADLPSPTANIDAAQGGGGYNSTTLTWSYGANDTDLNVSGVAIIQPDEAWGSVATKTGFTTAILGLSAYQVGSVIHIAVMDGTASTLVGHKYVSYDMMTDTFLATTETISAAAATTGQIAGANAGTSIVVRSTGEVVAFYSGVQTKTSGTFRSRVYYKRRTAVNTWSAEVQVDANVAVDTNYPVSVLGADDRVHFFWAAGASNVGLRTLSATNALNAAATNPNAVPPGDAVSYPKGGIVKVVMASGGAGQQIQTFDSSDNPTTTPLNLGHVNALAPHRIGVDLETLSVTIVYRSSADSDLYSTTSIDGGTYSTAALFFAGTVVASDAALSRSATGSLYERGSSVVIGYVVNDNGTWKYNEYVVRQLGASGTGTLVAGVADADGSGDVVSLPATGTGALAAQAAVLAPSSGLSESIGTGALTAVENTLVGTGTVSWNATGALHAGGRTNSVKWSEFLNAASWQKSLVTITVDAWVAPNGQTTADVAADNSTSGVHYLLQNSVPVISGASITISIYGKAGTRSWLQLGAGNGIRASFNLATGAKGTTVGVTANITPSGDGWHRCSITFIPASGLIPVYVYLLPSDAASSDNPIYVGDGSNLSVWGVQVEAGLAPTAYIATTNLPITVGTPPLITGAGTVQSPPVTGTGALVPNVAAVSSLGTSASVGTAGGLQPLTIGSELFVIFGFGRPSVERVTEHFLAIGPTITSVKIWLAKALAPTDGVQIKIFTTDANHHPTTTQVGVTSNVIDGSLISSNAAPYEFFFATPVPVTAGAEYAFVVERTGALHDTALYQIVRQEAETYIPGFLHYYTAGAWVDVTNRDIVCVINHASPGGLVALLPALSGVGIAQDPQPTGTGVLASGVATLAAAGGVPVPLRIVVSWVELSGTSAIAGTGALTSTASLAGLGLSRSVSTSATLLDTASAIVAPAIGRSLGTGVLPRTGTTLAALAGAGTGATLGTAALVTGVADLDALGSALSGISGTGALTSTASLAGTGESRSVSTSAALLSTASAIVAPAIGQSAGTGVLPRTGTTTAAIVAPGLARHVATGVLPRTGTTLAVVNSSGISHWVATGTLPAGASAIVSTGLARWAATATLAPSAAAVAGAAVGSSTQTSASLLTSVASISGFEGVVIVSGIGTLPAQSRTIAGVAVGESKGTGGLLTPPAALAGVGLSRSVSLPVSLISAASVIAVTGGRSTSLGTGALAAASPVLAGSGAILAAPTGTGALVAAAGSVTGVGGISLLASGVLNAAAASVAGVGTILAAPAGTGALASPAAGVAGLGAVIWRATATLAAQGSTLTAIGRNGWSATGTLGAQAPVATGSGVAGWAAAGALPAGTAVLAGAGVSRSVTTSASLLAARASVFGAEGTVVIFGSGTLQAQSRVVTGAGVGRSSGTGTLISSVPFEVDGLAVGTSRGTGTLTCSLADLEGLGIARAEGVGALSAGAVSITAVALARWVAAGALPAGSAAIAGLARITATGEGDLADSAAAIAGTGAGRSSGTGTLATRNATLFGSASLATSGFGELEAKANVIAGLGRAVAVGTGALQQARSIAAGAGSSLTIGFGQIAARKALLHGFADLTAYGPATLEASPATVSGTNLVEGPAVIASRDAAIVGSGEVGEVVLWGPTPLPGGYPGTSAPIIGPTATWAGSTALPTNGQGGAWWIRRAA